jgi:glyoxylase-like metal-dependent hydrolase (beta-lactamase superfamily II)
MEITTSLSHLHPIVLPTPFPVGPVTFYVGDAPGEPLTLVDTGPHSSRTRAALDAGLAALGHAVAGLDRIVVTHAHADHFGLAAELQAESGAELVTHVWNVHALADYQDDRERRTEFYAGLLRRAGVPVEILVTVYDATRAVNQFARPVGVDVTVDEGDELILAGLRWRVLHTPGHSAGLICLYEPASAALLSSDHLLADISSNPVVEPPPPGHHERLRSLALYRDSLQRVAAMHISRALPSHGPIIHDVAGLVSERMRFHERRVGRVLDALRAGARTTWDVTLALFPDKSPLDTFLAVSEVIGHLDLLEIDGRIARDSTASVDAWHLLAP